MQTNLLARRQEMLKLASTGFSLSHIVKELAPRYQVSERTIYRDWQIRDAWAEDLLEIADPKKFLVDIISTHKEIKRLAFLKFLTADNSSSAIGALRLLRDLNKDFIELLFLQSLDRRVGKLEVAS